MLTIPLDPVPNQRLTVRLDGHLFAITLKAARNTLAITITRDGEDVIKGLRCVPLSPLMPYRYLERGEGNFMFVTEGGRYPAYSRLGQADELAWLTADELAERRRG